MELLKSIIGFSILAGMAMLGCHSGRDISFSSVSGACLWNQAGGGAQRAGYSGAECTGIPSLAWKKKFKTPFLTEPSIAAGYLFLPAPNSGVIIIDAETGEMADVFKVGGPVTTPVAVLDSLMVLNEYGRRLSAVNWVTAERLWTVDIYGSDFAPLILDGGVYWHDGRGNITCFDLWEGKRIWGIAADYDIIAPPSACSLGVLFSSDKGRIECLSPRDGSVLWSSETGSRVKSAPAIFNDKFAFCTVEGRVVLADMTDGHRIWDNDLETPVVAPLTIDNEGIYIGTQQGRALRLEISDGHMAWSIQLNGPIKGGPSICGNTIVFPTLNHRVYLVDKNDGKILLDYPTFGMVSSRPAICSGRIYVAGEDEMLYCFQMLRDNEQRH